MKLYAIGEKLVVYLFQYKANMYEKTWLIDFQFCCFCRAAAKQGEIKIPKMIFFQLVIVVEFMSCVSHLFLEKPTLVYFSAGDLKKSHVPKSEQDFTEPILENLTFIELSSSVEKVKYNN